MTQAMAAQEAHATLNESGRIVIPASIRRLLGVQPGDEIILLVENDEVRMTTARRRMERAQQLFKQYVGKGARLSDELIADRRKEAARE
jgi:AbrB family looped-hinge helix DNA binding protein